MPNYFFLEDKAELDTAFSLLAKHYSGINRGLWQPAVAQCPRTGEVWQYMGSIDAPSTDTHEFRHRCHPTTGKRALVRVIVNKPTK